MVNYVSMREGYTLPLYELAPTNGKPADSLAIYYGYPSAIALAAELPPQTDVVDIGAGISDLGRVVAAARPDITWTYVDLRYDDPEILRQAKGDNSPPNVSYVTANILSVDASALQPDSFDRAFSSRLIPHIELEDEELARNALLNIGSLLREGGSMTILNRFFPLLRDRLLHHPRATTITKQQLELNSDFILDSAIAAIRLPDMHRWRQKVHNVHASVYYGQAQWRLPDAKGRVRPMRGKIWDPVQCQFIPRLSPRGHIVYGGFIRHALKDPFPRRATES